MRSLEYGLALALGVLIVLVVVNPMGASVASAMNETANRFELVADR